LPNIICVYNLYIVDMLWAGKFVASHTERLAFCLVYLYINIYSYIR